MDKKWMSWYYYNTVNHCEINPWSSVAVIDSVLVVPVHPFFLTASVEVQFQQQHII